MTISRRFICIAATLAWLPAAAEAEEAFRWTVETAQRYRTIPDVTYLVADGYESKLDVIAPRDTSRRLPTLLYIHGGGWRGGDKDGVLLHLLPYLEMGFAVVNVEYRLSSVALVPAAVEDCRCALRWVLENAREYGFDPDRIVVTGSSAGGHLTLTTGMLTASAGLDRRCPVVDPEAPGRADAHEPEMPVAAMINWYGITDVADLVEGPNAKTYAVEWMGGLTDWREQARRVSPLEYVRPGLPPILTIHGNADEVVPYDHAVRLHQALQKAGVPNRLHTVDRGNHGHFTLEENLEAARVIREFLREHRILGDASTSGSE
jgi:acetyl esterase/lipase